MHVKPELFSFQKKKTVLFLYVSFSRGKKLKRLLSGATALNSGRRQDGMHFCAAVVDMKLPFVQVCTCIYLLKPSRCRFRFQYGILCLSEVPEHWKNRRTPGVKCAKDTLVLIRCCCHGTFYMSSCHVLPLDIDFKY